MSEVTSPIHSGFTAAEKRTSAGSVIHSLQFDKQDAYDPLIRFEEFFFESGDGYPSRFITQLEEFVYMIYGEIHHADDLGNSKSIRSGEALRIISGKGVHVSEKAQGNGISHGIRLWVNTCREDRNKLADFSVARQEEIPVTENDNLVIKTVAGDDSPLKVCGEIIIKDILLSSGSSIRLECNPNHLLFLYNLSGNNGEVEINKELLAPGKAVMLNQKDHLMIHALEMPARFIFVSAAPVGEPNSSEELVTWY